MNLDAFNNLSAEEREVALKILNEYKTTGTSEVLNDLLYQDYKEIPVDIMTFISDDRYLGKSWKNSKGELFMYPFWQERLKELFPTNIDTAKNNVIESGARGIGKSEIMVTIGAYLMYRVMCLRNPHEFFNLKPTEQIAFAFMNITKYLAEDIGIAKFQSTVQASPWFMERGTITGVNVKMWNPPDFIQIIVGSQSSHVIGQPIFFAGFDEIDFIKNQDIDRQKQIAMDMIDTAIGGMKTRFIHKGKNPTVLVLASSKRSDKSFLEEHMKKKLSDEGESQNTLIVDEPVWKVKPESTYSGHKFQVALGNKFLASEVINENSDIESLKSRGYIIMDVPVEFRSEFLNDIDRALCDFAGIAASSLTKYISGPRLAAVKIPAIRNPFVKEIIEVGNGVDDTVQYSDFFDVTAVDPKLKARPLYIHLDMSISGDKTGIAGTWIVGKRPSIENGPKELYYQMAFGVSVKAPKGRQVSFEKNRNFIYWLKEQGFRIKCVTTDTFQNAAFGQDLMARGFDYQILSVDRVSPNDKICIPYAFLKNAIYEQRILLPGQCDFLTEELLGLERNGNTGKVDHSDGGRYGSKDMADALCGSLYTASQHAEEYAFEFGDDLDYFMDVSNQAGFLDPMSQYQADFEGILMDTFHAFDNDVSREVNVHNDESRFVDFGLGPAKPYAHGMLLTNQGIFV